MAGGPYINDPNTSGAPFMQSHRMSGHSREGANAYFPEPRKIAKKIANMMAPESGRITSWVLLQNTEDIAKTH